MFEDFRLRVFVTVVEQKSFTRAAEILGISQPAVSQNISELEKTIGTPLLDRSRNGLELNEKGKLFLGYAEQILHWYKVADRAFNPSPLELNQKPVRPAAVKIDENTEAEVWSSCGDIHIEIKHKN